MDGGLNGLVVFSCSALAYHSLYQLMKGFLVRRIFDPILKWQAGQKLKLSDGEVAHIANLVTSLVNAIVTCCCGLVVMWQASHDCIFGRSPFLIPFTHWGAQYVLYDLYALYDSDYSYKDLWKYPQLVQRITAFIKKRWSMVVHHLALFLLGYPLVVYPAVRRYVGDFIVGMFFIRDFFNPLAHGSQIMKLLNLQHTTLYRLTGIATLIVQFVTRILNWPLCILVYAAQYHDWDMVKAIHGLHSICIISMILWQVLETYWLMMVLRKACKFVKKKSD